MSRRPNRNYSMICIFYIDGRVREGLVLGDQVLWCFIFYNNMGNNNNAIETPKSSNEAIANNQKLQPIMFQEFGAHPVTTFKEKQINRSFKATPSKFSNQTTRIQTQQKSMMKFSQSKGLEINLKSISEQSQIKNEQGSRICVPFDVVKLVLQKDLKKSIMERQPEFMADLQKLANNWQLNSKGYYSNRNGNIVTTIKPGHLYQGQYNQNGEIIIPHGNGKLFTRQGVFQGEFMEGEAHGNGSYFNRPIKTEYKGVWRKGDLVNGQIIRDDFTFEGRFLHSVADGPGVITFFRQKSSYKGNFRDGLYEDDNGYFQSDIYAYSGGFKNGHKDGEGCLIEKQRNIKSVKKSQSKYHPQMEYQGFFQNDCYVGKKKYGLKGTS